MATGLPAKLKTADISRFALRAAQLGKIKPAVSYWCEYYILHQILGKELHKADKECEEYAITLMSKLEEIKSQHPDNDAITDDIAAQAYIEQFASETFQRADNAVRANKVSAQTADTFRAAATFFDMLSIWQQALDPEISSKSKYAKYHALRIAKALKAGEDPNLSNPKQEPSEPSEDPTIAPPPLDPQDPEVRRITNPGYQQPSVESAPPSTNASPPLPPAKPFQPVPPPPHDVSPISPPDEIPSRHESAAVDPPSPGGGYFPRVPTFTSGPSASTFPTAPPEESLPGPSPSFPTQPPPPSQSFTPAPSIPSPSTHYQQPPTTLRFTPSPYQYNQPAPTAPSQIPASAVKYEPDEEAVMSAQKHAKWAISALNFEDVPTAIKELQIALRELTGT